MAIEKVFLNNPIDVVYSGISFVQKWWRLLKPAGQVKLTETVAAMKNWLSGYIPNNVLSSDIVEM
jgi:hypothetical protein